MNKLLQILITIIVSLLFSMILLVKIKAGVALSFAALFIPIFWVKSKEIDEKKFIQFFFIIYPLLPSLAGISLGAGPALSSNRIAILLLITFLMSRGLFFKCYSDFLKSNIFTFNIVFLLISMFITSLFSAKGQETFSFTVSFILEQVILAVVVFSIIKTDEDIEGLIDALLISCTILCILGLFEKMFGYNFYTEFGVMPGIPLDALDSQMRGGAIRVKVSFSHSIAYGAYLVTIFPLYLYKFRHNFILFNASILLVMSAILASQSRAGQFGAAIVIILYLIFVERKNIIMVLIFCIPIIIYKAHGIAFHLNNINPLTTQSAEMADSTAARSYQFDILITYIKRNIAFGYGLAHVGRHVLVSIDNFYLLYAYQFGLAGLITYASLLISILIKPFRTIGLKLFKDVRLLVILFAIVAFAVINAVVALWSFQFIYYVYIGLIARFIANKRDELDAQYNNS